MYIYFNILRLRNTVRMLPEDHGVISIRTVKCLPL